MSGAMNRHCIPRINYVHSPDGETSLRECPGIIKTMPGLARTRIALCQRPGADTRKNDALWFSVERFV